MGPNRYPLYKQIVRTTNMIGLATSVARTRASRICASRSFELRLSLVCVRSLTSPPCVEDSGKGFVSFVICDYDPLIIFITPSIVRIVAAIRNVDGLASDVLPGVHKSPGQKLAIVFTCTKCETRLARQISHQGLLLNVKNVWVPFSLCFFSILQRHNFDSLHRLSGSIVHVHF